MIKNESACEQATKYQQTVQEWSILHIPLSAAFPIPKHGLLHGHWTSLLSAHRIQTIY